MAWFGTSEFECQECNGEGVVECECCDTELTCKTCDGSRLNHEMVDVAAFTAAERKMQKRDGWTAAWVENGKWLGRESKSSRLAIADFLRQAAGQKG